MLIVSSSRLRTLSTPVSSLKNATWMSLSLCFSPSCEEPDCDGGGSLKDGGGASLTVITEPGRGVVLSTGTKPSVPVGTPGGKIGDETGPSLVRSVPIGVPP